MIASAAALAMSSGALAQQPPPQSPNMTFFVTSLGSGKGGDLGGFEGADGRCQMLATGAGAGGKTWRAYLSSTTNVASPNATINARDRIGRGPWQNFKGTVVAQNVDDLHSDNNKLSSENSLTERGQRVAGFGMTPKGLPVDHWIERFGDWLAQRGLIQSASTSQATGSPSSR